MSYCRFSEADIYLYEDTRGGFTCCACSLTPEVLQSTSMETRMEVLFHVRQHRAVGDYVPDDVDFRLLQEVKEENPDMSMSELSDLYQNVRSELLESIEFFGAEKDVQVFHNFFIMKAATYLREQAEESATSSRDFGRGYMYAVKKLESLIDKS